MTPLLETRCVSKQLGSLVVTNDVSLSLEAGARHALIGPNGAGKTTFVNLLTGRLQPDAGNVLLGSEVIDHLPMDERVRRGLVRTFQINQLLVRLSVLENVQFAVLERKGQGGRMLPSRAIQRAAAEEAYALLERFGLADAAMAEIASLPYGRQRLVEVTMALAMQPKVLLLDEPAAGVPPADSQRMMELIGALPGDVAILVIEHDMDLVFRFARDITVLSQGAVLCSGSPEQVLNDARVREVYLGGHGDG